MFDPKDAVAILALVVSVGSLAFTVFKGRYDQITGVKPALVFEYDHETGWQIQNIGAGPALNIVVAKKEGGINSTTGDWIQPVRVPPLKKDGALSLHWDPHNNTHGLGATCEDMWARSYTTTCGRDLNRIRRGLHLRTWTKGRSRPNGRCENLDFCAKPLSRVKRLNKTGVGPSALHG
jgi:hypothetical protein